MKSGRLMLIVVIALVLILAACGSDDSKQDESYTIGVLMFTTSTDVVLSGFKEGMAELGYLEGEKVEYIHEMRENNQDALVAGANKLIDEDKVDLILALATPATTAAKTATEGKDIPVVFVPINDPVSSGFVASMREPGGNLTGVRIGGGIPKELEWLLKIVPEITMVFAPYNPNDNSSTLAHEALLEAAETQEIKIIAPEVTTSDEVLTVFQAMPTEAEAIFMAGDGMIISKMPEIVSIASERGIPTAGFSSSQVQNGALMGFGFDSFATGKQTARLAVEILSGTKPADLPVETAEFYLSLNLITAEASGIVIPDDVLRQASGIIVRPE